MQCLPGWAVDRRGNVAITFAVIVMFLMLCVGIVLDYGLAVDRKRSTDNAVDQALLAATVAAGKAKESGRQDWAALGEKQAKQHFATNLPVQNNYSVRSFNPILSFKDNTVTATATYSAQSNTTIMKLFQKDFIAFSGETTASVGLPNYVDIHFVIDGSGSMGIGAELADQRKMYNSPSNCAFACHQMGSTFSPAAAHNAGAKLRIDVVREAIQSVISKIQEKKPRPESVRVALHLFSTTKYVMLPLTSDLDAALAKAATIDLMNNSEGGSYISFAIKSLADNLSAAGDGTSASSRASFIVLLTDGIDDSATSVWNASTKSYTLNFNRDMTKWITSSPSKQVPGGDPSFLQPFSATPCATLKSKGHRVLAVQIKYLLGYGLRASPDVPKVNFIQGEMARPLTEAFRSCATNPATDHVVAQDSPSIGPVLNQIVDDIVLPKIARLVN